LNFTFSQHLQRYEEKKKIQQNILNAVLKFNLKPKDGIKYLIENKLIEDSVEAIVEFLKTTPSLNKTQIGDYLGGAKPNNISVMHAFIDSIDFADMALDEGIRKLCTHFKLPGEAAQIDRIMQKFAEKYCLQNGDIFKLADDAYILSYAIIMLNVALWHPDIKKRMTKEEFGKNNLLAVTDQELLGLMHEIYDRIQEREILLDDKSATEKGSGRRVRKETAFAGFAWMNGLYSNPRCVGSGKSFNFSLKIVSI
jgi:Sec7-like guanine-nucleotide exchange factor